MKTLIGILLACVAAHLDAWAGQLITTHPFAIDLFPGYAELGDWTPLPDHKFTDAELESIAATNNDAIVEWMLEGIEIA